jgi:hypothetical protein
MSEANQLAILVLVAVSSHSSMTPPIAATGTSTYKDVSFHTQIVTSPSESAMHISVAPRYIVLNRKIDQIRFQCYTDGYAAKQGKTSWTREDEVIGCNTTKRVFSCVNILIITGVSPEDAGQYKCILKRNTSSFFTVSVFGNALKLEIYLDSDSRCLLQFQCHSPSLAMKL